MKLIAVLFFLLLTVPAQAQPAFDTLLLSASPTLNLDAPASFSERWSPGYGGHLEVATPFYSGFFEIGAAYHTYGARQPVPVFDALHVYGGYGFYLLDGPVSVSLAGRLGSYRMQFDEPTFEGVRTETELTTSAVLRADIALSPRFGLFTSGTYQHTYTFVRLGMVYASAGLSYLLPTPSWLKSALE
ncbi:MAG: hypothetical protein RhofKO_34670 [Rhodothermales bacterium]